MKRFIIPMISIILLLSGLGMLFASPSAEVSRQKLDSFDFATTDVQQIVDSYDLLYRQIITESELVRERMSAARAQGESEAYRRAYGELITLSSYTMSREETSAIAERIATLREPERSMYAQWLYRTSRYYRPTLILDFSLTRDTYRFGSSRSFSLPPGTPLTLPNAGNIRINRGAPIRLLGWGYSKDTIDFRVGEQIPMPVTDETLYAIWDF